MSEVKRSMQFARSGYEERLTRVGSGPDVSRAIQQQANGGNSDDVGSLEAYRNWMTRVQAPEKRRSMADQTLFSWKAYRSWADQVSRDWDDDA